MSRQLLAELLLGGFPVDELLFARCGEAVALGGDFAMPGGGGEVFAGEVAPQGLHEPELFGYDHLLEIDSRGHGLLVAGFREVTTVEPTGGSGAPECRFPNT